jgi:DNA primase
MYNTALLEPITKKLILEKLTEYDIYSYYMVNKFEIGKVMSSPFRSDKNPSFAIFKSKGTNELLYKDHGTGLVGDCISFVSNLRGINYSEALDLVYNDLIENKIKLTIKGKQIQEIYNPVDTIISILKKNFTINDDEYWGKYKVIDRKLLKRFDISPIYTFWINDRKSPMYYTKDFPLYAYKVFDKYKIYSPYADKKNKWRNNCGLYDLQGLEQLEYKQDTLIITKSLKDVLVLTSLGYESIAPHGEDIKIPENIMNHLKQNYKNIVIFYDNDEAGIKCSNKICRQYNLQNIRLDSKEKDISDYIENHTIEETKDKIKEMLCIVN